MKLTDKLFAKRRKLSDNVSLQSEEKIYISRTVCVFRKKKRRGKNKVDGRRSRAIDVFYAL